MTSDLGPGVSTAHCDTVLKGQYVWLVDAHVHIHPAFDRAAFLRTTIENFRTAGEKLGLAGNARGVVLLTEMAGVDAFSELESGAPAGWRVEPTQETVSIRLVDGEGRELVVVAGRQIATAEGVEVLALGTCETFRDGGTVDDALHSVMENGAMAVLPWGVGKWLGARGGIIERLARDTQRFPGLYLGDNGNRPRVWPRPRLFGVGEECGRLVLPGSDPLPLPGEVGRAGRFGFIARADLGFEHPMGNLRRWLSSVEYSPSYFGTRDGLPQSIYRQVMLRVNKS